MAERTIGDWTAYQDDDGGTYYHNETTGESSWDPPPGFVDEAVKESGPEPEDDDVVGGDDFDGDAGVGDDGAQQDEEVGAAQTPPWDGDNANDDTIQSPVAADGDNDGITQSPINDGFTQSPPMDDGITQSPSMDDGITQSPPMDDGITQSPPQSPINEAAAEEAEEENEVADGDEIGNGWVAYKDEEGRIYYYNAESGETQWDRPDVGETPAADDAVVDDLETTDRKESYDETANKTEVASREGPPLDSINDPPKKKDQSWPDDDKTMDAEPTTTAADSSPTKEEEPENTAATAEEFLQRPDAVMEPTVVDHINILVQELGPQVAGPKAMQSLMNGYGGDTAVCGLMGLWLADLKSMGGGRSAAEKKGVTSATNSVATMGDGNLFQTVGANAARDVVEEVVNRLAKERFTKDRGDAIVKLSKKEAAFIDKMIKSGRWRKLLIDLSATTTNKDSKLFMYCLQSISNLGHHRDIANRINQSDYFGVFNSMLQSELCIAARIAVDGYTKEVVDSIDYTNKGGGPIMMGSLIADLRRTCTSTSYTYLYAMKVLKELISKSNNKLLLSEDGENSNPENSSLKRAVRKWERLREELEDEMLKPIKTGTTFQRKRRIDVALTMSDLFQRKRRRNDPRIRGDADNDNDHNPGSNISSSNNHLEDTLDSALSQLLTKNSLGIQIDKEIAENMLKFAYGGSTDRIGDLLIQHPSAITALLHNLFGAKRIRQLEIRLKCARLVALAVTASKRSSPGDDEEEGEIVPEEESSSEEDLLSQVILKGSQLCEQLENMVSFTVLDNVENNNAQEGPSSVGRQLSAMCIQHSVVAQGVLIWAKELANGSDFVTTASYPTISPCILSLARLICRHHPLTRPAVLDVSLVFMGHSNREISHQKMSSIKEQCLRLMLWLTTQGLSLAVISAVQSKLERGRGSSGSSEMDSALVRYFFTGILEIVRPPFSLAFVRALGGLMMKGPFVDALQSKHFEHSKRGQIVQLIDLFEAAATGDVQKIASWEEDESLLSMLKSTYCSSSNNNK